MRPVALALAATAALGSVAHADALDLSSSGRMAQAERLRDEHESAVAIRNTGIALTVLGTVLTVGGSIVAVQNAGLCFDNCPAQEDPAQDARFNAGVALFAVGQVAATAGISMWAAGGSKASKTKVTLVSLGPTGATLRF